MKVGKCEVCTSSVVGTSRAGLPGGVPNHREERGDVVDRQFRSRVGAGRSPEGQHKVHTHTQNVNVHHWDF